MCKAPAGKEVEELTKKEIHKALRAKIPIEQYKEEHGGAHVEQKPQQQRQEQHKQHSSQRQQNHQRYHQAPRISRELSTQFKRMLEEICKRQFFKEMERFKELCLLQERISNIENRKMSNMWEQRELRDTSQRQKQTEQRLKQFNGFMPILSQSCNSRVY